MKVLAWLVLCACALLFIGGLAFRATLYPRLPVAPGEAYGLADIIEYGIGMLLLVAAASGFALGVLLIVLRRFALVRLGVVLLVFSLAAALAYRPLHSFVASL